MKRVLLITGPAQSGKTTMARVIKAGFESDARPGTGAVIFDDLKPRDHRLTEVKNQRRAGLVILVAEYCLHEDLARRGIRVTDQMICMAKGGWFR